jgi:hypothetical protein
MVAVARKAALWTEGVAEAGIIRRSIHRTTIVWSYIHNPASIQDSNSCKLFVEPQINAMTIYVTLLTRGHFPKELPPAFFTEQFAQYATTKNGRATISNYQPADNFTECVKYRLALPGLDRRELRIPHPASFAILAELTAKNLGRLLKKASGSKFSRSRPVYATGRQRAIQPMVKPSNLSRERAAIRAGASFLLKADVSQFYPSLYTHAVGWAVDPKLRLKANWQNRRLLGKKLDQALMNGDGKVSQGIPIGNDISFLLAEVVMAQVDKALKLSPERAYRWFDDFEIAFDTSDQAESALKKLNRELSRYQLRLNTKKTRVVRLPQATQEHWQETLKQAGTVRFATPNDMVKYFDTAFRLREVFPDAPVLLYALGLLFRLRCPEPQVGRIAQSCLTQALLSEPGAAQKAFALLSFWHLNGFRLDFKVIVNTINQMILRHQASGLSSDISWALAFCLEANLALDSKACQVLSVFDDDCIALQALHMHAVGLLPRGFSNRQISKLLKHADLDREHWLLAYETVRHGYLSVCDAVVKSNALFSELLVQKITFYRTNLPSYALVVHPGGAPEWVVRKWMDVLRRPELADVGDLKKPESAPMFEAIRKDFAQLKRTRATPDDVLADLLDIMEPTEFAALLGEEDEYAV